MEIEAFVENYRSDEWRRVPLPPAQIVRRLRPDYRIPRFGSKA